MAERQQKLLANRIAGTPRLSEQAIDDERQAEATSSLTERSSINSAGGSICWTARGRRRRLCLRSAACVERRVGHANPTAHRHWLSFVVSSVSLVSATKMASSFAGSVALAFSLMR
jgi:hypothetical protein